MLERLSLPGGMVKQVSRPTIVTVDDDPLVSAAITRDLAARYGTDYRVVRAASGPEALSVLARLALRDDPVALIAADQRMPGMTGIEMLGQARAHSPGTKMLLLTAYADTDVAIQAINDIGLDYYLLKPWDPPEERLYPVVDDLLGDWQQANPERASDVRVVGHRWSDRAHAAKLFLARNHVPYRWYDVERDAEGGRLRDLAGAQPADLPLVLVPDGDTLRAPSTLPMTGHARKSMRRRAAAFASASYICGESVVDSITSWPLRAAGIIRPREISRATSSSQSIAMTASTLATSDSSWSNGVAPAATNGSIIPRSMFQTET